MLVRALPPAENDAVESSTRSWKATKGEAAREPEKRDQNFEYPNDGIYEYQRVLARPFYRELTQSKVEKNRHAAASA
jgi:hypothetical protein